MGDHAILSGGGVKKFLPDGAGGGNFAVFAEYCLLNEIFWVIDFAAKNPNQKHYLSGVFCCPDVL